MQRLHIHISVKDIKNSIKFYRDLFNAEPVKVKDDYVKWRLTNPPINFAISNHGAIGLNHPGIEADHSGELDELYQRITPIEAIKDDEGETICCYARSVKNRIEESQGSNRELFHSLNDEDVFIDKNNRDCSNTDNCGY